MNKDKYELEDIIALLWIQTPDDDKKYSSFARKVIDQVLKFIESKKAEWQEKAVHDHELKIRIQENKFAIERIKEMTRQKIRELQGRQRLLEEDLRSISKGGDSEQ